MRQAYILGDLSLRYIGNYESMAGSFGQIDKRV